MPIAGVRGWERLGSSDGAHRSGRVKHSFISGWIRLLATPSRYRRGRLLSLPLAPSVQLNDTARTSRQMELLVAVEVLAVVTTAAAVPNVVRLSQTAAQTQITECRPGALERINTQQASATVPIGTVISETSTAGTQVSGGTAVALVVSSGPQLVAYTRNVVGLTQATAQNALCKCGPERRDSDDADEFNGCGGERDQSDARGREAGAGRQRRRPTCVIRPAASGGPERGGAHAGYRHRHKCTGVGLAVETVTQRKRVRQCRWGP